MPKDSPHSPNRSLKQLGEAIAHARKEREVSQEALAHETGIDRAYLSAIELGKQNMGVLHLVRIASALNMTVTELVMEAAL